MQITIEIDDGCDLPALVGEIRDLAAVEAAALEWIEPVAARIGLSRDATQHTLAAQRARLRTLVRAERILAALAAALPNANAPSGISRERG